MSVPEQQAMLQALRAFALDGRTGGRAGEDGFNASISWRQLGEESQLHLSGPMGAGGLKLVFSPQELRVTSGRGDEFAGEEAASLIADQLGFVPPFESLRYWVLGLVAPGEPPSATEVADDGHLTRFIQQGWQVSYDRRVDVATGSRGLRMPQKLTATRAGVRLQLVVERWDLRASD